MARKTIADLEKELAEMKEKNTELQTEIDESEIVNPPQSLEEAQEFLAIQTENAELKETIAKNTSHTNESEARLMAMINGMEEAGGDTGACLTFTPDEYRVHSAAQGRIMGRLPNQKTKCSIEELRSAINSDKTPSWLMEKHGMTEHDLQQLIWKLSSSELRDRPIKLNIKRDFFGKEA